MYGSYKKSSKSAYYAGLKKGKRIGYAKAKKSNNRKRRSW